MKSQGQHKALRPVSEHPVLNDEGIETQLQLIEELTGVQSLSAVGG